METLLKVERDLTRKNFDVEACYYQLKSRYLMVLNHFKSPEKPGKSDLLNYLNLNFAVMEPGVLRQLLEEANRTPRDSDQTDTLGFYLKGKTERQSPTNDLLDVAAGFMEKANDLVQARSLVR